MNLQEIAAINYLVFKSFKSLVFISNCVKDKGKTNLDGLSSHRTWNHIWNSSVLSVVLGNNWILCWIFLTLCMCRPPSTHLHIIERTLAQSLTWYILFLLGLADLCNCHFELLTLWWMFKDTWHSMRYFQGRE